MGDRLIELRWKCGECGTDGILGRHKRCPQCGSPRERGEMRMSGLGKESYTGGWNTAETVTDPELTKLATAGADWFCKRCGSGNTGTAAHCGSCGASLHEPKAPEPTGRDWSQLLGSAGEPDFWGASQAFQPPPPREPPPPSSSEDPEPGGWWRRVVVGITGSAFALGLAGLGGVALLVWALVWAFQTHEVPGTVSRMSWRQDTVVEAWTTYTVRRWLTETLPRTEIPPTGGKGERAGMTLVGGCREEWHHDEKYQCGTRQESYDCAYSESYTGTCSRSERYACGETCRDNGNGFASCSTKYCSRSVSYSCTKTRRVPKTCTRTVPRYCSRPIYETKCDYATQEWRRSQVHTAAGEGTDTRWPTPELGALERQRHVGDYSVQISYTDRGKPQVHKVAPTSEAEYKTWRLGEALTMQINNLGGVRSTSHGSTP